MDFERIIKKVKGHFDSFELFYLKEKTKKYESRDLDINNIEFKEEEGIALRGIRNKRLVFSYTFELNEYGINWLLSNCKELLPFADEDDDYAFSSPYDDYPILDIHDKEGINLDDKAKKELVIDFESSMKGYDKRIVTTRGCELHEEEIEIYIINSKGIYKGAKKTLYALTGMAVAKDKDEVSWYDWKWSNFLKDLNAKEFGIDIAEKAISFLGSSQINTGIYNGILKPQAVCDILGILSSSFLGENLFKNKTKLKEKIGKRCFSEELNIIDSGRAGINAFLMDGEGIPSKENHVVENGVFLTFLYDNYYGKKFKRESTGNSVRTGVKEPPRCGIRGLFIKNGNTDLKDDILNNGIIIKELIGAHTANPTTGEFSLGAIGHLIKNNKIIPFKEVIFSGNVFELLNNIKAVGTDIKFYGIYGSPSLLVEGIRISGK
ncbi:MAG TPA: metallopeptidase TldD-related protein [Syntrophorhabdaceae bacterium]|nr:metallopeptidase TldD-related protein [Syntrophorhabdaceae bacterium]HPU29336.1 metallopeptidase TldD-related protein [Syntrophorhabdaceae bacterium]